MKLGGNTGARETLHDRFGLLVACARSLSAAARFFSGVATSYLNLRRYPSGNDRPLTGTANPVWSRRIPRQDARTSRQGWQIPRQEMRAPRTVVATPQTGAASFLIRNTNSATGSPADLKSLPYRRRRISKPAAIARTASTVLTVVETRTLSSGRSPVRISQTASRTIARFLPARVLVIAISISLLSAF
jgi:hypothetical protein